MLYILLALALTPIIEIAVFIEVGDLIGLWPTLAVVVVTAFLGTFLLRQQGMATMRATQDSMNKGEMPMDHMIDGLCLLVAGLVLLTPGFVTDAIGFLLFIPPLRRALARNLIDRMMKAGNFRVYNNNFGTNTVIDGDFEDLAERTHTQDRPEPSAEDVERLNKETDQGSSNPNSPWASR